MTFVYYEVVCEYDRYRHTGMIAELSYWSLYEYPSYDYGPHEPERPLFRQCLDSYLEQLPDTTAFKSKTLETSSLYSVVDVVARPRAVKLSKRTSTPGRGRVYSSLQNVQPDSTGYPGSLSGREGSWPCHIHQMTWLRKRGALSSLSPYAAMACTWTDFGIFQQNGTAELASQFYVIPTFMCLPQRNLTCAMTRLGVCEATLLVEFQVYMAGNVKAVSLWVVRLVCWIGSNVSEEPMRLFHFALLPWKSGGGILGNNVACRVT